MSREVPVSRYERHLPLAIETCADWTVETIAAPAAMFGANGITVGPDGLVYIAEWLGDRVTTWDPVGRELGTAIGIEDPLDGPDDLAFDSEGTLFITSYGTGKVCSASPGGELRVLLADAPAANGITVHDDRLFVTEFRTRGRTLQIDRRIPERFRVISDRTDNGNALQMGPDGRLHVPNVLAGTVTAIDPLTGAGEVVASGLGMISAVKFDPAGRLAVSLQFDGVVAIDLTTGVQEMLAQRPHGEMVDNFCFDAAGDLYLTLSSTGQLERYRRGLPRDPEVVLPGGFIGPYGLAHHQGGRLLVADYLGLYDLALDGTATMFARVLDRAPVLAAVPVGENEAICLSRAGDVFHVTRHSADTTTIIPGSGSADFSGVIRSPGVRALCRDGDGIAVGSAGGEVRRLAPDGTLRAVVETGLGSIDALAVTASVLVAADEHDGTVRVIRGEVATTITGLDRPCGVAVRRDEVVVAERGSGTISLHPAGGAAPTVLAAGLPLRLPTRSWRDDGRRAPLLVDDAGDVIVGCAGDGSVRRLSRGADRSRRAPGPVSTSSRERTR